MSDAPKLDKVEKALLKYLEGRGEHQLSATIRAKLESLEAALETQVPSHGGNEPFYDEKE